MPNLSLANVRPSEDVLSRPITIAVGRNRQDTNFKNIPANIGAFLDTLNTFQVGTKDGLCILQGELVGGNRIAKNMRKNYVLIIDVETGVDIVDVVNKIRERRKLALVWTTHSHGKSVTEVNEEHFLRWAKKQRPNLDHDDRSAVTEALTGYLSEEKRYTDALVATLDYKRKELRDGGMKYVCHHAPMPRLRVILFLDEPFDFTTGSSQKERIETWKKLYVAVCNDFGIPYDSSCVDPSRLHYTPRVPEGAEIGEGAHEIILTEGELLSLSDISLEGAVNPFTTDDDDDPGHEFATRGLDIRWAAIHHDFDIATFVSERLPDIITKGEGTEKLECECPNADSHSDGRPGGFYVETTADSWKAGCQHEGCKQASKGDRMWWLDLLAQKAGIEDADGLREWSEIGRAEMETHEAATRVASDPEALKALIDGLDKSSTPTQINEALRVISTIDGDLERESYVSDVFEKLKRKIPATVLRKQIGLFRKEDARATGNAGDAREKDDKFPAEPDNPDAPLAVYDHWA